MMKTLLYGAAAMAFGFGLAGQAAAQDTAATPRPTVPNIDATTMAATGCNQTDLVQLRTLVDDVFTTNGDNGGDGRQEQIQQQAYRLYVKAQNEYEAGNIQECAQTVEALRAILPGVTVGQSFDAAPPALVQNTLTGPGNAPSIVDPVEAQRLIDACRTGNFAYWRNVVSRLEGTDDNGSSGPGQRQGQQAYQLLVEAQNADSEPSCVQALAALEQLSGGITVGLAQTGEPSGVILPGGVQSDVVPNPSARSVNPSETAGVASPQDACQTRNFAAWNIRVQNQNGNGASEGAKEDVQEDAYRLLARAQGADSYEECIESLAQLDAVLQGIEVGVVSRGELTYPPGAVGPDIQSDVAIPEEQ